MPDAFFCRAAFFSLIFRHLLSPSCHCLHTLPLMAEHHFDAAMLRAYAYFHLLE